MTEWNPDDPDAVRVHYDLSEWDFDQQGELAAALAESEIPHGWEGTELVVPDDFEDATDAVFVEVEQRLGIIGKGTGDIQSTDADDEPVELRVIADEERLTEYPLNDWKELERTLVGDSLTAANVPFRWEESVLLVPTTDETVVEQILFEIESGDVIPVIDDGPDGDELPFESLNSFFLAGARLRKDPGDADGLERLLDALKIADPNRPPSGVELRLWRRTCELAEELADALVDGSEADEIQPDEKHPGEKHPDEKHPEEKHPEEKYVSADDGNAFDRAADVASKLHDLLRPLI